MPMAKKRTLRVPSLRRSSISWPRSSVRPARRGRTCCATLRGWRTTISGKMTSRHLRRRVAGMALDPEVLKARIHFRVCELKALAAWREVNCRGHMDGEYLLRALPRLPPRRDREQDDDEWQV